MSLGGVDLEAWSTFFAEAGEPSPVPAGAFFNLFPVSVMTPSTLAQQNKLQPESSFGECRVRMNVIVSTEEVRFVKNKWAGRDLTIGDAVRLNLALPDPRCVMTTLAQDELPWYPEILRTLVRHNRIQVGDGGQFLCAVTYAVVLASGTMQTGDHVSLT